MKNLKFSSLTLWIGISLLIPLFSFSKLNLNNMKKTENLGLYVIVNAKPEKAAELKQFLSSAIDLANQEAGTKSWYAFQVDATTFGIFDTFENEEGRNAHLNGDIAAALLQNADHLLVDFEVADIKKFDVLVSK